MTRFLFLSLLRTKTYPDTPTLGEQFRRWHPERRPPVGAYEVNQWCLDMRKAGLVEYDLSNNRRRNIRLTRAGRQWLNAEQARMVAEAMS